jgi:ribose 1,5-bisphosphokinase PhnN
MSDGHVCFVRDLGPVKGGKGMKHHEVIVDFNRRGMVHFLRRVFTRPQPSESEDARGYPIPLREPLR